MSTAYPKTADPVDREAVQKKLDAEKRKFNRLIDKYEPCTEEVYGHMPAWNPENTYFVEATPGTSRKFPCGALRFRIIWEIQQSYKRMCRLDYRLRTGRP